MACWAEFSLISGLSFWLRTLNTAMAFGGVGLRV